MKKREISSVQKIRDVITTLFPIAAKRFPFFFPLMALETLCDVLRPFLGIYLTPMIVDGLVNGLPFGKLMMYAAILAGGETVFTVIRQLAITALNKYQERLGNYFRERTGEHVMNLDFQLTEDKKALDQLEKANTGMDWYSGGVYGIAEQFFMFAGNVLKIGGFTAVIALRMPLLLAAICVYVAIDAVMAVKANKVELQAYDKLSKVNRLFSYFGWSIVDFRYGKDIRLYDGSSMLVNKWDGYQNDSVDAWKWQAKTTLKYQLVSTVLDVARVVITYGYAGLLAIRGMLTPGTFTQMVESAGGLDATLSGLVWNVTELFKRCNYAYEYILFERYPAAMPKGTKPVPDGLHRIEFRNVTFAYPGTDRKVLDGVNLTIEPGERLSLVGLNGAGKTTLVKLLCRLYDPSDGQILMDGTDIREYDYVAYMKQFAPVFQDFKLFGFSVLENICLKDANEISPAEKERAEKMIRKTGLTEMTEKLPKGMDTRIYKVFEEDGVEPSGGEQQKLAIARALYKDAPVVILDEPTAALDPVAEYDIYRQFDELVENRTALYISHRLSSSRFCDRIAVFSGGRVAEYGTHEELVNMRGGLYAAMFEAQAQYYR
ncbi:MAG: ABC transporter ATP-binding protein/permease [Clostridia bacterium]|nr:ABC transporter ATP-binding protein/permease [Clostridia bacterium]